MARIAMCSVSILQFPILFFPPHLRSLLLPLLLAPAASATLPTAAASASLFSPSVSVPYLTELSTSCAGSQLCTFCIPAQGSHSVPAKFLDGDDLTLFSLSFPALHFRVPHTFTSQPFFPFIFCPFTSSPHPFPLIPFHSPTVPTQLLIFPRDPASLARPGRASTRPHSMTRVPT